MGRGVARRKPSHVTSKVKVCVHTMFKIRCSKGLSDQCIIFMPFLGLSMKIEMVVVIYVYLKHFPDYIDSKCIGFMCLIP